MIPTTPAATPAPPETIPVDRLHRLQPEVYRGLVAQGLLASGRVGLEDGLLVEDGDLYRMPLDVYDRAADLGLLGSDDRVELIDGLLVDKMTRKRPHVLCTELTADALKCVVPKGWHVERGNPLRLPSGPAGHASVPEPDVAVVRGQIWDYRTNHPGPGDVGLAVEVSETSLRDERIKSLRYAWSNIPSAWIVDMAGRKVEAYTRPTGPTENPKY